MAAKNVEEYMASVPEPQRRTMEALRAAVRAAAPEATEVISYGMPTYKLRGRMLFSIGAAKAHCALYGGCPGIVRCRASRLLDEQGYSSLQAR